MSTVPTLDDPIDGLDVTVREITTSLDRLEATVCAALETGVDACKLEAELGELSGSIDELLDELDRLDV